MPSLYSVQKKKKGEGGRQGEQRSRGYLTGQEAKGIVFVMMVCSVIAGSKSDIDHHPGPAIAALMKLSFDEDYRHAICTLGMTDCPLLFKKRGNNDREEPLMG